MKTSTSIDIRIFALLIFAIGGYFFFGECLEKTKAQTVTANVPAKVRDYKVENRELVFGVTTDSLEDPSPEFERLLGTLDELKKDSYRLITRVVIEPKDAIKRFEMYKTAIRKLRTHSEVMLLLADSHDAHQVRDGDAYAKLYKTYIEALGDSVIWEIGNEVNGEWFGWKKTPDDPNKLGAMRNNIKRFLNETYGEIEKYEAGHINTDLKVAMTLYYNDNDGFYKGDDRVGRKCWEHAEDKMQDWASYLRNEPKFKKGLDYLFISFYQDNCFDEKKPVILGNDIKANIEKDSDHWIEIFTKLSEGFDKAKVGFGEFAPECKFAACNYKPECEEEKCKSRNRKCPECINAQTPYILRYYREYHSRIKEKAPKYVGGYFYWTYNQDVVHAADDNTLTTFKRARDLF
jgi:hypothetical protein